MQDESLRQLQKYITQALAHGQTKERLIHDLQQAGWPPDYIGKAFVSAEQASTLLSAPMRPKSRFTVPPVLRTPLAQSAAIGLAMSVANMTIFLLFLPPPTTQIANTIMSTYSDNPFPKVLFQILITSFVIALVTALILMFRSKKKAALVSPIITSFMAVFIALIAAQDQLVGLRFSLSLLIAFPLAQVIWHYSHRWLIGRIIYFIATFVLFMLSVRVLNLGSL